MPRTPSRPIRYALAAVVLIAAGLLLKAWLFPAPAAPRYVTAAVTRGDIEQTVIATGTLEARNLVSVGAQVSGRVVSLKVELGDAVEQGQLIAEIDSLPQQNALRNAEAGLATLRAQRSARVAALKQAELTFKRQQEMMSADATSRAEYEAAEASLASTRADISALDAQIEQGSIQVDTAKLNLGYTKILAPIDGTVVAVVTKEGQTVNANQSAPTIVKLAELSTLTIKAQISEADVVKVAPNQKVWFTILGEPDRRYYAQLRAVEPAPESIASETTSNNASSTSSTAIYYNGLFDVPNPDGKLRISMTATVNIVLGEARDALLVPSSAIVAGSRAGGPPRRTAGAAAGAAGTGASNTAPSGAAASAATARGAEAGGERPAAPRFVRVLGADGEVVEKPVRVGLNNNIQAEILEGLSEGDQVVLGQSGSAATVNPNRRNMGMRPPPGF
ncbi:MAG TPA: efflux RND transporter periplasmic adaptor subunit [Dokdonella sp.]|uniref:efflux RND transporter periplasmic adaptor subunit n=1 Tax=Dokdonella sp. TaxID=2291710 RepID=UPI002C2CBF3E|nr:efflux RND transporter periplasmic adaptor subunit [Dokdonella sp.]HUD40676.1 efflux RND transporter periplasmic adaptor subunit [Dokdonella sp.]